MEEVKILEYKNKGLKLQLEEIYQATQVQLAFATEVSSGVYKQEMPFVLCRDFLHDAVRVYALNSACSIYGFVFNARVNSLDLKRTLLLIKFPDSKQHINTVLHLLHLFEKRMRIKKTIAYKTKDSNIFLLEGSKSWQSSPQFLSLYTFLMRLAANKNQEAIRDIKEATTFGALMREWRREKYDYNNGGMDIRYLPPLGKYLSTVISNRSKLGLTFEKSIKEDDRSLYSYHNSSGIMSLCNEEVGHQYKYARKKHEKIVKLYMKNKKGR